MTMPTVTEHPLALEAVEPDPFIDPSPADPSRFGWWEWLSGAWRDPDSVRDFDPSPYSWR